MLILIKASHQVDGRAYLVGAPADAGIPGERALNPALGAVPKACLLTDVRGHTSPEMDNLRFTDQPEG